MKNRVILKSVTSVTVLIMIFIFILIYPPADVYAEESAENNLPAFVSISIDDKNVYKGMNQAYQDGYIPKVEDDKAILVLPLIEEGEIRNNEITASLGLGDPSICPFVYANYQKKVFLKSNRVSNGGNTISSYLVYFEIPLKSDRKNGAYPISINIQAQGVDGSMIMQTYTTYVSITDGIDKNLQQQDPSDNPLPQPKLIVSGYDINPKPVFAGDPLTVTVKLLNTNETEDIQNITVNVFCDSMNFSLQNSSNVIYIKKLGKGQETKIELTYITDLKTPAQRYNISLDMDYCNSKAQQLFSKGTIPVDINQPINVELKVPIIEKEVNAGDTMPLSFQVINLGYGAVHNVRVELSAPGLIPLNAGFIGSMSAGTAAMGDINAFIGSKDMSEGYEGTEKYGLTNGTIKLIYEDDDGNEYIKETEFSTFINNTAVVPPIVDNTNSNDQNKAGQWWVSITISAFIIIILILLIKIRNRQTVWNS